MAEAAVATEQNAQLPLSETAPGTRSKPGPKPGYKPFNNETTPEDFFVLLSEIPDAEWPKSLVYVWRRDPFTDNTNGGREPKYIDVINRAVSELNIKEEHGSGTYKLQLNTNDKYVSHTILTIEDPKFPPHVPPGDWFQHPRNKKWLTWKPLVEKWWTENLKQLAGVVPASSNGEALQELTRLVSQLANNPRPNESDGLSKVLITWALQQTADERKAGRDSDSPGKIAELIRAVKDLMPPPAPPPVAAEKKDDPMMAFVLAQLTRLQESNDRLVAKMLEQKTDQANPLSQVETMAKLISTVSGIVQPAAPKEPWVEVVENLGPGLVAAADKFATGMAIRNAMPRPPQPQQPLQPQPQAPPQPQPQIIPAQAEPVTNPAEPPAMDNQELSILFQVAALAANALNLGMDGEQFADQICYKFGQAVYDQFIANVPKESLLDKFKQVPEAWQLLQPFEPVLPSFIDSFYAYAEAEEEEDPKNISEPPPVKQPAKKKTKGSKVNG